MPPPSGLAVLGVVTFATACTVGTWVKILTTTLLFLLALFSSVDHVTTLSPVASCRCTTSSTSKSSRKKVHSVANLVGWTLWL